MAMQFIKHLSGAMRKALRTADQVRMPIEAQEIMLAYLLIFLNLLNSDFIALQR